MDDRETSPMSTTPRWFDGARFIGEWRALCAQQGIDPVEGATTYQVIRQRAARIERMRRIINKRHRWWVYPSLWKQGEWGRSPVETEAFFNLYWTAEKLASCRERSRQRTTQMRQYRDWVGSAWARTQREPP